MGNTVHLLYSLRKAKQTSGVFMKRAALFSLIALVTSVLAWGQDEITEPGFNEVSFLIYGYII